MCRFHQIEPQEQKTSSLPQRRLLKQPSLTVALQGCLTRFLTDPGRSWKLRQSPIRRFHQIEPQEQKTSSLSRRRLLNSAPVTSRPQRSIPYPLLHENTLVLSDNLVVNRAQGRMRLMFRCASCQTMGLAMGRVSWSL